MSSEFPFLQSDISLFSAEHVLRMRVVTANGTILDLSPDKITIHPQYAREEKSFLMSDDPK